ncbi:hypothetical protein [Chitinophaga varians]|uniref:hypothetical protein n=1 Tax=Chitinophaga varians TaxID=2202339 RepID=UPI00165FB3AF|nr:hypothetical protein [Chitinophaga varians]MBC9908852.1 hypothetical protein [Chitinophaga varians]
MKERRSAIIKAIAILIAIVAGDLRRKHLFFDEYSGLLVMDIILALYLAFEAWQLRKLNIDSPPRELRLVLTWVLLYVVVGIAVSSGDAAGGKGVVLWIVKAGVLIAAVAYGLLTLKQIKMVRKLEESGQE